jgi:hypothetical protein
MVELCESLLCNWRRRRNSKPPQHRSFCYLVFAELRNPCIICNSFGVAPVMSPKTYCLKCKNKFMCFKKGCYNQYHENLLVKINAYIWGSNHYLQMESYGNLHELNTIHVNSNVLMCIPYDWIQNMSSKIFLYEEMLRFMFLPLYICVLKCLYLCCGFYSPKIQRKCWLQAPYAFLCGNLSLEFHFMSK